MTTARLDIIDKSIEKTNIWRERRYGSFTRSIALPTGIDPDKIEATCKDGVLEVTVPLPEEAKKRAGEIKPKAAEE